MATKVTGNIIRGELAKTLKHAGAASRGSGMDKDQVAAGKLLCAPRIRSRLTWQSNCAPERRKYSSAAKRKNCQKLAKWRWPDRVFARSASCFCLWNNRRNPGSCSTHSLFGCLLCLRPCRRIQGEQCHTPVPDARANRGGGSIGRTRKDRSGTWRVREKSGRTQGADAGKSAPKQRTV